MVLYFTGREIHLSRMHVIPRGMASVYLREVWLRVPARPIRGSEERLGRWAALGNGNGRHPGASPHAYTERRMRQRPGLVLILGFGGLLLLMAAAEVASFLLLNNVRQDNTQLQEVFLARNRILEQIRSHIYLSGTLVRDSLLAPEASGVRGATSCARGITARYQSGSKLSRRPGDTRKAAVQALQKEIEDYWKVLDSTFAWSEAERNKYRYAFFYEQLVPRRTSMLQIADQIEALNEAAFRRGNGRVEALFGRLQIGLLMMIAITLAGGATLAGFTISTSCGWREAQRRLEESMRAQGSLQDSPPNWSARKRTSAVPCRGSCMTKWGSRSRPFDGG